MRVDGDDPPIIAFVENNNHDESNQPNEYGKTKIYWKHGYNNRVHGNDMINLFVNFRELQELK